MSKRSNQKLKLLYLYRIMLEQTDSTHGLTLAQISQELAKYGIYVERKTLYDDIEALRLYGLDIQTRRKREVRYGVVERPISHACVKLIGDTVRASSVFTERDKDVMMRALVRAGGKNSSSLFTDPDPDADCYRDNNTLLKNIESLCSAMVNDRCVVCRCFEWNSQKQRIMRFDGECLALSPWYLESDGSIKLIAYEHKSKKFMTFAVDHLIEIETTDIERLGENEFLSLCKSGELQKLLGRPEPTVMRFRCSNDSADDVISYFGINITVFNNNAEYFEFSVKATPDASLFSWLIAHASDIRILSPDPLIKEYALTVRTAVQGIGDLDLII